MFEPTIGQPVITELGPGTLIEIDHSAGQWRYVVAFVDTLRFAQHELFPVPPPDPDAPARETETLHQYVKRNLGQLNEKAGQDEFLCDFVAGLDATDQLTRHRARRRREASTKEVQTMTASKTQLCVRCSELVPQGCCTCGEKQELTPLSRQSPELAETVGDALGKMLLWHDAVRREVGLVPSPNYIEEVRAAYKAWEEG